MWRGVDLLELELAREHLTFPFLLPGHVRVKFRHNLVAKHLQALANMSVAVLSCLVEEDDLIDV